jgi:signal transduction histidine kinase
MIMAGKTHSKIKFLQDNKQVVYSLILMIVIPGALIFNTWLLSGYFRNTVDQSIHDKAIAIGLSINTSLADKLDSPEAVQSFIDNWQKYSEETKMLDVMYLEKDSFKLVASIDKERVGEIDSDLPIDPAACMISWKNGRPLAQKVFSQGSNNPYWLVLMPLTDLQGEKKALLAMEFSTDFVSFNLMGALVKSYLILMLTVVLIILLLYVNSHLFEYSILYNKIKEIDAMKDDFISIASHELRTPVVAIKGFASMIIEESQSLALNEKMREYVGIISASADRLAMLIEDLLNVSRIDQGRFKMDLKEIDAWPVIEETLKEFTPQANEKKLALSCVLEPGSKTIVLIDRDRFKQSLINVIGNAVKYTPSGSVEVRARSKGKSFTVTVKDTGIGMTAKEREHLFDKFYRIKKKETEDIIGTGLGLWITRQMIGLMKGSISVDSIERVGSQVTIELPLAG